MRAGHREDVGGAFDQGPGERLAPETANVDAFLFANVNRVQARRLPANGVDAGGSDLDVFPVANEPAEKAFRHWAPANVSSANKEDAFHGDGTGAMPVGQSKTEPNQVNAAGDSAAQFQPGRSADAAARRPYRDWRSRR
jgi:hypothetical protein